MPRTAAAYRGAVLASEPVGYWPLDEPAGSSVATDVSGAGHNATAYGNPGAFGVPGPFAGSTAYRFTATLATAFLAPSTQDPAAGFTLEYWARPSESRTSNSHSPMGLSQIGTTNLFRSLLNVVPIYPNTTGVAPFQWGNGSANPVLTGLGPGTVPAADLEWRHWTWTFDATSRALRLTRDGTEVIQVTLTPSEAVSWQATHAVLGGVLNPTLSATGVLVNSRPFFGDLAHATVFDRALTAQEIATHYNASEPAILTNALPIGTAGQPYEAQLEAEGGVGTLTWSIADGALPPGLTLDPATGVISGTPEA